MHERFSARPAGLGRFLKGNPRDFPGGPAVKPLSSMQGAGSVPGEGTKTLHAARGTASMRIFSQSKSPGCPCTWTELSVTSRCPLFLPLATSFWPHPQPRPSPVPSSLPPLPPSLLPLPLPPHHGPAHSSRTALGALAREARTTLSLQGSPFPPQLPQDWPPALPPAQYSRQMECRLTQLP